MRDDNDLREFVNRQDITEMKSQIAWSHSLGVYYKYFGEDEKAKHAFEESATKRRQCDKRLDDTVIVTTWLPDGTKVVETRKRPENDPHSMQEYIDTAVRQIEIGIEYGFAGIKPDHVKQLLEWAIENCTLTDEEIGANIKHKDFCGLALMFLWHGYGLLLLGRYTEAYPFLSQAGPYFIKDRNGVRDSLDYPVESRLPIALAPLCEYKLNTTEENRCKAVEGLEKYMGGFPDSSLKFDGLFHYYFLKEKFPEIYGQSEWRASESPRF